MTKNILITGISGMLGMAVYRNFSQYKNYKIFGVTRQFDFVLPNVNMFFGDLSSEQFLNSIDPILFEAIIHCSAEVNVNLCETNKELAYQSNVQATQNLFSILQSKKYIYISTDSVFEGLKGNYTESSEVHPLNYYAETKLLGENTIKETVDNHYILRTNIYGFSIPMKKSLFEWAYSELNEGKPINGFRNMYFNPMYVGQLAKCIESFVSNEIPFGTYNVTTDEKISKYNFLLKIAQEFSFPLNAINEATFNQNDFVAPRALNTTLDNSKLKSVFKDFDFSFDAGFSMLKSDFMELNN
jgi:dTDP-4-dehydrorhamnose reductase